MVVATPQKPSRKRAPKCCAICGVALKPDRWIYSRFTGSRYCPVDEWEDCSARSLKRGPK